MISDSLYMIFTGLNVISSIVSTYASVLIYRASKVQLKLSESKSTRDYSPYLYPENAWFRKSGWIRFCDGVDSQDYIPSKKYVDLTPEEKRYVDNCKKHENAQKVYFDLLDNKIILVANMSKKMPSIAVEHGSTEIRLVNYGEAAITKLTVNAVEFCMLDGRKCGLDGGVNNSYTHFIPKGESISILLDEVINSIDSSTCQISEEKYRQLEDIEIFANSVEILQYYDSIIVAITLENIYGEKFDYRIIVEKKDDYLERDVQLISIN